MRIQDHEQRVGIDLGREAGRIEVFHRTQRLADEGRAWFETLAGAAVQRLTCEITDPAGHLARTGSGDASSAPNAAASNTPDLPPEVIAQAIEQVLHRHYANWSGEAIPALGGLTPHDDGSSPPSMKALEARRWGWHTGQTRSQFEWWPDPDG